MLGNTILWGMALPIVKKGFDNGLTPMSFLFWRYVVAVVTSLPIVIWVLIKNKQTDCHGASPAPRNDSPLLSFRATKWRGNLLKIIVLELIGTVLSLILLYEGLSRTGAIEGSLIAITYPILVTLGGIWFFKEREEKREWIGLSIAILGTFILVINPLLKIGFAGTSAGNLLILGQNITIAAYYLLAKYNYQGLNKWVVTHISFWVGMVGFGVIGAFFDPQIFSAVGGSAFGWNSPWPLFAVLYMGFAGSVLALTLYLIGQDKIEASEAAIFTYAQILFTIPASMWLLGEGFTALEAVALMIIMAGVLYNARR